MKIKKTPQQLRSMGIVFIGVGVSQIGIGAGSTRTFLIGTGVVLIALGAMFLARSSKAPNT